MSKLVDLGKYAESSSPAFPSLVQQCINVGDRRYHPFPRIVTEYGVHTLYIVYSVHS